MSSMLLDRYLGILDISKREPDLDTLSALVRAHVTKIPFENLSKLFNNKKRGLQYLPDSELYLDGIERFNLGGTCYANNYYLYLLLANIGYQVRLCGADMSKPDVHLVSIVTLDDQEYIIDAGYAAPFLDPLPRDLAEDYVIALGRDRYLLKPKDPRGRSLVELHREGVLRHAYRVNPAARQIDEFRVPIADSFGEDATFMNGILLARFFPGRSSVIRNLTVIESSGTISNTRILSDRSELFEAVWDHFGIPPEYTKCALNGLEQLREI